MGLIPDVRKWTSRKYRETSYFLTQVLTRHGCFKKYLHRIVKRPSRNCSHYKTDTDTVEHTLFVCPAWKEDIKSMEEAIG